VFDYNALTTFKHRVQTLEKQLISHHQDLLQKEESITRLIELMKVET